MAGQADDPLLNISQNELHETVSSEVRHCFYQAAGRGHMRILCQGKAGEQHVYFFDQYNRIKEGLIEAKVFPNASWYEWVPKYLKESKPKQIARLIREYLEELHVKKVSTRKVRDANGFKKIHPKTWTRSIEELTNDPASGWTLEGRSFVRLWPLMSVATD